MSSTTPIIETLRARISLAELIGETVDLVRSGEEARGECPAHRDPEKGLFVLDAKGFFRCYSCGRQGDVVQWTRETAGCSEEAAIATLCERAGLAGSVD